MDHTTFDDHKFCQACDAYVRYLMSVEQSHCVQCGGVVRLFSNEDWSAFHQALAERRPKGGRPAKKRAAAVAS